MGRGGAQEGDEDVRETDNVLLDEALDVLQVQGVDNAGEGGR